MCRYHGIAKKGNEFLIVMEHYGGGSLTYFILNQPQGKVPLPKALDILKDICRGLQELHRRNVAVLDLKPDNVLMTEDGTAVLADFGISRIVTHTISTVAGGTPNFQPPEQFDIGGQAYQGPKCDMWALACTFLNMVTGQAPMEGFNQMQMFNKVRK